MKDNMPIPTLSTTSPLEKLRNVDHLSLEDMAKFFEEQAEHCRMQAATQKIATDGERIAAGMDFIVRTPRIVIRYLNKGYSLEEAMSRTSTETGAPITSIERAWNRFTHDKSIYETRRRNRLILELAAMGFSNADIGKKVHLHSNSVSRIISRARKDYHKARVVDKKCVKMLLSGGIVTTDEDLHF
mgnify:CR=1 FL=1